MKKQRYARADTPVAQLPQGTSTHAPPAHTVPHEPNVAAANLAHVPSNVGTLAELPMPLTRALVERGRERFGIYCAVCHGEDGYGAGIVVRRGFPAPPSLHEPRLREAPIGYVVQVITQGHGLMYSYADRIDPADRWAIAAYISALQFSQHAPAAKLAEEDRNRLVQSDRDLGSHP